MKNTTEQKIITAMIKELTETEEVLTAKIVNVLEPVIEKSVLGNKFFVESFRRGWATTDYPMEFTIRIQNEKYQWSHSGMISSAIKISKNGSVEADFNHGSGGWNEKPTIEILDVFASGIKMIKSAIRTSENNSLELFELLTERFENAKEISELYDRIRKIEKTTKIAEQKKKAEAKLKCHKKVSAAGIINALTSGKSDFNQVHLVKYEVGENFYKLTRKNAEFNSYGRKTFWLGGSRISRKDLTNFDFSNYYLVNLAQGHEFYGTFREAK